jgi:tripartite-type tricarboxylate transporter receptor subunit TctC
MKVLRISAVAAMLACCCMIHTSASAEQFPSRMVKFLVPQAAGGATDVFARKLAQMLSERWGQPIIVENRAGAAGVLGTDVVAKSAADGYTLLVTYAGSQAVNPSLYPLAVSSAKRVAVASDVPTIVESGFLGFDVNPWWGILAPARTDTAVVRRINRDVNELLQDKDLIDFLATQGAEPFATSPEEFLAILKSDVDKWAKVIKAADVKLN